MISHSLSPYSTLSFSFSFSLSLSLSLSLSCGGYPRCVMVKAMDCGIVVRQSRYYVHFRANTLGKGMSPLTLPAMG